MRATAFYVLALLLLMPGCARVSDNLTKDLDRGADYSFEIPPQKSPLKVEVTVESSGAPLVGCLYPASKSDAAETHLLQRKQPPQAIAFVTGQSSFSLSGTVPANEAGKVWLENTGTEKTTVKVKVVGY